MDEIKNVWKLTKGDKVFVIKHDKDIISKLWENSIEDIRSRDSGNVFATYYEAQWDLGRRQVETELLKCGGQRGFIGLDYFCCIMFDNYKKALYIDANRIFQNQGTIYFAGYEDCQKAIDTIGEERIKKYLFDYWVNKK